MTSISARRTITRAGNGFPSAISICNRTRSMPVTSSVTGRTAVNDRAHPQPRRIYSGRPACATPCEAVAGITT